MENKLLTTYKIIRQPYRITMAQWKYSVLQKRILTVIISKLQKEITLLSKGMPIDQLDLFSSNSDTVEFSLLLNHLVKKSNNYKAVKEALNGLRKIDVEIILPLINSKKNKAADNELILTGLIERAVFRKNERTVKITMHRETAIELVKVANGLTYFAEEVMFLTDNSHTQKIYEILSHWKDKEVVVFSIDHLKEKLGIDKKYADTKAFVRRVIKPTMEELKKIGDIYFEYSTKKMGTKITHFNFIIKHRKDDAEKEMQFEVFKNDTITLLKSHFKFTKEHIEEISCCLINANIISLVRIKLTDLIMLINEKNSLAPKIPAAIPRWVIACLKNEFPVEFAKKE